MEGTEIRRQTDAAVSRKSGAKRASDIRARWPWVEPAIWTDRMLSALEKGVKGGVWLKNGQSTTLRNAGCILWNKPGSPSESHFDVNH